jgi:hypothetical protein
MTLAGGDPRRLRDLEPAPGSSEEEGRTLLRAAEPHVPPAGSKARVRAALRERRGAGHRLVLRPALALVLVVASGAVATGTSLGRRWVDQGYHRLVGLVGLVGGSGPRSSEPAPVARTKTAPAVVAEVHQDVRDVAPAAPVEPLARAEAHAPRRLEERPMHRVPRPQASPVVDGDDPEMVAAAVRALRRDHDAARAGALLETYVRRWPNGALVEEAMALSIEAAQAQEQGHLQGGADDLAARALAHRYLQRFPTGRFSETARRALARPAP